MIPKNSQCGDDIDQNGCNKVGLGSGPAQCVAGYYHIKDCHLLDNNYNIKDDHLLDKITIINRVLS